MLLTNLFEYAIFRSNTDFHLLGNQHLSMIFLTILLALGLTRMSKKHLSRELQIRLGRCMTLIMATAVIGWIFLRIALGEFDYKTDLPFDICNMVALLLPLMMWTPAFRVHEIIYFWIFAGTTQAVLTPHLLDGFPHFTFIKYWTVHGGLVVFAVYATVVYELKPTWKSLWRSFLMLQTYIILLLGINLILGSNYAYLMGKPPTASALDYLGDYPWYLLITEGLAVVMFVLALLPVQLTKKQANLS